MLKMVFNLLYTVIFLENIFQFVQPTCELKIQFTTVCSVDSWLSASNIIWCSVYLLSSENNNLS